MPLVPVPLYTSWFKKTSLVHRSFVYLWRNELWSKTPPKGFSLCPYWWLSLFSLFIFRPLVQIVLAFRGLISLFRLDRGLIALENKLPWKGPRGLPTVVLLMMLFVAGVFLILLGSLAFQCHEAGILSAFVLPIILLGSLFACGVYADNRKGEDRCPVEVYLRIVTVLCVAAAFILHPVYAFETFVVFPWDAVTVIGGFFWWCISGMAGGIWFAVKWTAGMAAAGAAHIWIILAALIVGYIYSLVVFRMVDKGVDAGYPEPLPKLTRAQIKDNLGDIVAILWQDIPLAEEPDCGPTLWRLYARECPEVVAMASKGRPTYEEVRTILPTVLLYVATVRANESEAKKRRDATCRKVTGAIMKVLTPVTAGWRQIKIGASYAWQLIKAYKGKQCPYIRFED